MDLSEEEACKILEISLDEIVINGNGSGTSSSSDRRIENIDEEKLKRQYRKLAIRYHPDKNPDGREKFVAVQKAYERLQVPLAFYLSHTQKHAGMHQHRDIIMRMCPFFYLKNKWQLERLLCLHFIKKQQIAFAPIESFFLPI